MEVPLILLVFNYN